jgi:hypothetical protein
MTNFRKALIAAVAAAALIGSQAGAADLSLAPGKPAGVREAQRGSPNLWLIGGAATVAVIGIVIATQSSNDAACGTACSPPATTTSTS